MSSAGLSIGELVGTISLNDQFSGPFDKVAKALGVSSESFKAVAGFAGIAAGAVASATAAVVALGIHGSDVSDVQQGFSDLSEAAGSSAEVMLGALQRGTLNTISNFELMKLANSALGSGMIGSAKDMETLAAGAKLLSGRVGGDTSKAFDIMTDAVAKGKPQLLKQLGIYVDSDNALQAYADSVHKSVKNLSDHERATALSQAALAAMRKELDGAGPATASFSDRINQGKAAVQNFVDNVSVAIANSPAVAVAMEAIATGIQDAFGGDQQTAVQTITGYVNKFAIFLVQVGEVGVEVARFLSNAWDGLKIMFNDVIGVLFSGLGSVLTTLGDVADAASTLPGLGDKFEGVGAQVRAAGDDLKFLATGFHAQSEAALDSAADTNLALDKVGAGLEATEMKMRAVDGAQVQVAGSATKVKQAHEDAAAAASHYSEVMAGLSEDNEAWRQSVEQVTTEVDTKFLTLMNDITMASQTEMEARLTAIAFAEQQELTSLANRQGAYGEFYEILVTLTQEKYRQMSEAALGHFATVEQAAEAAGFKTRAAQQETADNAKALWEDMTRSGKFSDGELERAHKKYTEAVKTMDSERSLSAVEAFDLIAGAASSILRSIFGKSKAAAIAAVIIDVAAGVIKSFAQYGWPWGLVPAAAITAQGFASISKINSTDGSFEMGTPGTSFVDFGRESHIAVHGPEAVINQAQGATLGEVLSDMVRDALQSGQAEVVDELRRQGEEAASDRKLLPYRMQQFAQFARA